MCSLSAFARIASTCGRSRRVVTEAGWALESDCRYAALARAVDGGAIRGGRGGESQCRRALHHTCAALYGGACACRPAHAPLRTTPHAHLMRLDAHHGHSEGHQPRVVALHQLAVAHEHDAEHDLHVTRVGVRV